MMAVLGEVGPQGGTVTQLRAYLAQAELPDDGRLPPERDLSEALGVSRTEHASSRSTHVPRAPL